MPQTDSMTITTMYRGVETRVCHSDKEREAASAEGFKPYNPADHAYPRWMYKGADSRLVKTEADAAGATKEGFGAKPTDEYARALPGLDVPHGTLQGSIDDSVLTSLVEHEDAIASLRQEIQMLQRRLAALEAPSGKKG